MGKKFPIHLYNTVPLLLCIIILYTYLTFFMAFLRNENSGSGGRHGRHCWTERRHGRHCWTECGHGRGRRRFLFGRRPGLEGGREHEEPVPARRLTLDIYSAPGNVILFGSFHINSATFGKSWKSISPIFLKFFVLKHLHKTLSHPKF